jgi:ribosomal protein S4
LARHREAVCRLCRREGMKLYLKGLRCFTEKCAIEKRNFVPGQHGQARQFVNHGHVRVKGRKVNIPNFLVSVGDDISIKDKMLQNAMVLEARNLAQSQDHTPWLEVDRENCKARVIAMPRREDLQTPPLNEQLIVELYSK